MEKQKEKNQDFFAKYISLIEKLNVVQNADQLRAILREFVHKAPHSAQTILKNPAFDKLYSFVIHETSFLFTDANLGTRCWYVLNDKHSVVTCHNCGVQLERNIPSNSKSEFFWCGAKCQGRDRLLAEKISKIKIKNKRYSGKSKNDLPLECHIAYRNLPISYDDNMNAKLLAFYEDHKKVFSHWICHDKTLYDYLLEKSYPIDYTRLKIETRVKWVIDKMQRFPICKSCGRQIYFVDVKMSHHWPEYCCTECRRSRQNIMSYSFHAAQIYGRMENSEWTRPLFSFDDFKTSNRKLEEFKFRCLNCSGEFYGKFDLNFYNRNGMKSYFRCPHCFPFLGKRKKWKDELEIFDYVRNQLRIENVKRGDRQTIYPFELDIHPMTEFSDIAIEYNGAYWHSVESSSNKNHILNKVKMCEDLGIKLLVIWEDDFLRDKKKTFQFIYNFINDRQLIIDNLTCNGSKEIIEVDRSVFNKAWSFPGYDLIDETQPKTSTRQVDGATQKWTTPDAGTLIYKKSISESK